MKKLFASLFLLLVTVMYVTAPPILFKGDFPAYLFYDTPGIKQFPATPGWSYSRRLTTNYNGPCLIICTNELYPDAGTGTAEYIYFTNNITSATAISNFAAGGDAWVVRVYDQTTNDLFLEYSGSGLNRMPKVCTAGTVFTQNGLVAVDTTSFGNVSGYNWSPFTNITEFGVMFVGKDVSSPNYGVVVQAENMGIQVNDLSTGTWFALTTPAALASYTSATNNFLLQVARNFDDIDLYTGSLAVENITVGTAYTTQAGATIYNYVGTGYPFKGYVQELILLDNATNSVGAMKANVFKAYGF